MSHKSAGRRFLLKVDAFLARILRIRGFFWILLAFFCAGSIFGWVARAFWLRTAILVARKAPFPQTRANVVPQGRGLPIAVVSSAYSGGHASRVDERVRVAGRNAALRSVRQVRLLREHGDLNATELLLEVFERTARWGDAVVEPLSAGADITYAEIFRYTSEALPGRVVVVTNADIYFDESIACAGLLREGVALALSRHPSPDCVSSSGHGDTAWEPQDLCAGYDPVKSASHDSFAFVSPLPNIDAVVNSLGSLRVNVFGAENVVIWTLKNIAGLEVLNPCGNVHAFHAHCDAGARASTAHQDAGNEGDRRRQFGATSRFGYLDPALWASPEDAGLDCLLYGSSLKDVSGLGASGASVEAQDKSMETQDESLEAQDESVETQDESVETQHESVIN